MSVIGLTATVGLAALMTATPAGPTRAATAISTAEWKAMLARAQHGGVIELGQKTIPTIEGGFRPDRPVTIKGGVFGLTSLDHWKNVTFEGSRFVAPPLQVEYTSLFVAYGPENLAIKDCRFTGYRDPSGELRGRGITIREGNNVTVQGSVFENMSGFLTFYRTNNARFLDNDIRAMREGVNVLGGSGIRIERNRFEDFQPWDGDHADGIQIFTTGLKAGQESATHDAVIKDNLILSRNKAQGIFITDDYGFASRGQGYRNFTIENNLIVDAVWHGITFSPAGESVIRGNRLVKVAGEARADNRITANGARIVIQGNEANAYLLDGGATESGNNRSGEIPADKAARLIADWKARFRPAR